MWFLRLVAAFLILWAIVRPHGPVSHLSPPPRLKLCRTSSIAWSGVVAALAMITFLYMLGVGSLVLAGSEVWLQPVKMGIVIAMTGAWGGLCGILRMRIRRRWPEAIELAYLSVRGGAMPGMGFYVDEFLAPALVFLPGWAILILAEPIWGHIFGWGIMAFPVMYLFTLPAYGLWAWFHSGMLGWLGRTSRLMEYEAYEALCWDDNVQRWLGTITITTVPAENKFVVTGSLPDRSTLTAIRRRLEDIRQATVDTTGVSIDPELKPDYRRLSAYMRRGTYGQRRRVG